MSKILVIDDSIAMGKLVCKMLRDSYEVCFVESWPKAISLLTKEKVDLILMDVQMPGLQGDQIAMVIRQPTQLAGTKIILFSSMEEEELRKKAEEGNADGYILKTSDAKKLLSQIKLHL